MHMELPQLSPSLKVIKDSVVLPNLSCNCDMIPGRDLMRELGLKVDFEDNCIHCQHLSIPMENPQRKKDVNFVTNIKEPKAAEDAVSGVKCILDAKCAPVSCQSIIDNSPHLTEDQKQQLLIVLEKHKSLFDGTLGKWKGAQHKIELKDPTLPPMAC